MSPRKSRRMPQISVRLSVENLIAIDVFIAHKNLNEVEIHRNQLFRSIIGKQVDSKDFQEIVKQFRQDHPTQYKEILEKYARYGV